MDPSPSTAFVHPVASSSTTYPNAQPPRPQTSHPDVYPDEKAEYSQTLHAGSYPSRPLHQPRPHYPVSPKFLTTPSPYSSRSASSIAYTRPRGLRIVNLLRPWTPVILYVLTSLSFVVAISFWKVEVFQALDDFSQWLKSDEYIGYATIFMLIFITTFPPIPLYSTFIVLSGYTFGAWTGAIISYAASLVGALVVFAVSRTFFRGPISRWLSCTVTVKRVVRAIEKRPKLLFLIRLAPYPYNVMNCLLAASPTLTLRTYTTCTALSLFKLIIHTSIGSSIHSFAQYHVVKPGQTAPAHQDESPLGHYSTIAGAVLCVGILIYLSYVARKAVDEELDDDLMLSRDSDETVSFLSDQDNCDMEEVNDSRPASRPPSSLDDRFLYGGREEASIGL
ncbi:hypothetical protein BDW22DRAFT_1333771 [Trametopsis cervina]|nr:hypothetical protein BDW22DRAFT_1333771 [Trametopsis cervina]